METKWYEFQVGLFVEASNEEDALRILYPVIDAANKIDPEEDAAVELVNEISNPYGKHPEPDGYRDIGGGKIGSTSR